MPTGRDPWLANMYGILMLSVRDFFRVRAHRLTKRLRGLRRKGATKGKAARTVAEIRERLRRDRALYQEIIPIIQEEMIFFDPLQAAPLKYVSRAAGRVGKVRFGL